MSKMQITFSKYNEWYSVQVFSVLALCKTKLRCPPFSTKTFLSCHSTTPLANAAITKYDIGAALSLNV